MLVADERTPLLYLVHRIPYPPNKGDKVRSFNILRQLARRHRVFLGTFVDHPDDVQYIDTLAEWCEEAKVIRLDPRTSRLASLRGLLTGEALSVPYYRSAALAEWVGRVVAREGITQAVAFSGPMAQYLDAPGLKRRIVDFCDLDSAKWTQYAGDHRWPMSWLYRREGRSLLAFERAAAARSEASLFVTDAEAGLFKAAAPEVVARVGTMQNGVDSDFFSPEHGFANPYPDGGPVLLFTGAMDYWPNIDAVVWFASELLPKVRAKHPDARFWIVGMNPAPVVISSAPATGLEAVSGRDCEIAHSGDEFVSRIFGLLANVSLRPTMGQAARQCVLNRYSWAAHLATLENLLDAPHHPNVSNDT